MHLRDLRRRGGIILGAAVLCAATFQMVGAQAQHQNVLLTTSDPGVLAKVLAVVKQGDPAGFRFDATLPDKGRVRHMTYGALPLSAVSQVSTSTFGDSVGRGASSRWVGETLKWFIKHPALARIQQALAGVDKGLYTLEQAPESKPLRPDTETKP